MIFTPLDIDGVYQLELEPKTDARGFFSRAYCREEFLKYGLIPDMAQANIAWSIRRGTLRGLHYQTKPHEEAKLLRCTRGAAWLVVADIRPESPTFGKWISLELSVDNRRQLYVPPGCAQGYQTLVDNTELYYQMSVFYAPAYARGVRFDDPMFQIEWPLEISIISEIDKSWPLLSEGPTRELERARANA